jgi:alpha-tubulin suppressor-like RCC1 family protein
MKTRFLWAFGRNQFGQLGHSYNSTQTFQGFPKRIEVPLDGFSGTNTSKIFTSTLCAGGNHSVFKTADERLFAMGRNTFGQLGVFDQTSSSGLGLVQSKDKDEIFATRPFPVGSERYSGVGWRWIDPFAGRQIDSVHCAYDHTVVVSGNQVFTFGANRMGQLLKVVNVDTKNPTQLPEPIEAALFLGHAEAVSPQLTVKAWASGDSTFVQTLRQSCGPSSFSIDGFQPCWQCDAGKYEIRNASRSVYHALLDNILQRVKLLVSYALPASTRT